MKAAANDGWTAPALERASILVVDDHVENIVALRSVLQRDDYEIVTACGGAEALRKILKHDFAVILLDVLMPGLDGFQTARLIRERDRSRSTPILFLTATGADLGMIDRAYSVGAVDYLVKPLDPDMVRAKVAVFVDLHRKTREVERRRLVEGRRSADMLRVREAEYATDRLRAEEGQRLLARSSEVLLSSLDVHAALATVAALAVPALAPGCAIFLCSESGACEGGRQLVGFAGEAAFSRRATIEAGCAAGPLPDLGPSLVLPLAARGHELGAVALLLAEGQVLDSRDCAVAEDLAQRVAFAVDNARLYEDAQQAVRLRDEFLSIASHELRTPLTPLQLNLQRLLDGKSRAVIDQGGPEKLRAVLVSAQRQVQRLAALVDNLLDVSRITMGQLELHREDVDLRELALEIAARFDEAAERAGTPITLEAEQGVHGSWDRLRLEQVMTNLLSNAVKYGDAKPIGVEVRKTEGGGANVTIRDQGIGIAADHVGRIFGRFERAVSARNYGGLGLGLYITRQIVEAHAGRIGVDSEEGKGSAFYFELPGQGWATESSVATH